MPQTAFQKSAFQNNAFQIVSSPAPFQPAGGHGRRRDLTQYNSYNVNLILAVLQVLDGDDDGS